MKKLLLLALLAPSIACAGDDATHWITQSDKSSIEWSVSYGGKPLTGELPFTAEIFFDPKHLSKSNVDVTINTAKVTSSDKDAKENLPGAEWFASKQYPTASFKSSAFQTYEESVLKNIKGYNYNYVTEGTLTLRGKPVKITMPFSLKFSEDNSYVVMNGEVSIKRLDFGVGTGDWQKTDTVGNDVKVTVHLEAKRD